MTAPVAGVDAVMIHFRTLLLSHLQTAINTILAEQGDTFTLTAPDAEHTVLSRSWAPPQKVNGIQIFAKSEVETGAYHNIGAPVLDTSEVEIQVWPLSEDTSLLDTKRARWAQAIKRVIVEQWRTLGNPAAIVSAVCKIAYTSLREQAGVVGVYRRFALPFGASQDIVDPISVLVVVRHFVACTVEW